MEKELIVYSKLKQRKEKIISKHLSLNSLTCARINRKKGGKESK
jgi:hypothetical protein